MNQEIETLHCIEHDIDFDPALGCPKCTPIKVPVDNSKPRIIETLHKRIKLERKAKQPEPQQKTTNKSIQVVELKVTWKFAIGLLLRWLVIAGLVYLVIWAVAWIQYSQVPIE